MIHKDYPLIKFYNHKVDLWLHVDVEIGGEKNKEEKLLKIVVLSHLHQKKTFFPLLASCSR